MSGAAGEVASIDVLDLSGRLVERVLQASQIGAEMRRVPWSGARLAPGTYVVRLRTSTGRASFARWTLVR